ncbi:general substrate transporter [Aspergillus ambiguus]|uniref:general substrate transporter n=1 Tax=Aspergillus ambiguus TaxID=176160 RepID=UPI003CCD0EA8
MDNREYPDRKEGSKDDYDGHIDPHKLAKLPKHWWEYPALLKLNIGLLSGLLAWVTTGFDGSMLNGLQAVPSWTEYFDNPSGARLGTMANGFAYGNLITIFMSFWLCERFGRRWPLFGSALILIVGTIVQTAAQNFVTFVLSRFIVGMGTGILGVVSLLLLAEVSYPTHRAVITAMTAIFWPVGALIAAAVTYGTFQMQSTWAWRLPSLLQGVLPVVQMVLVYFTPESPRWLVDQNRREEAEEVLVKYHGLGDQNSALVHYELVEISAAIETEKINRSSKWKQWFSSRGNFYRLALLIFLGFARQLQGNALVSYYLVLVLESIGIRGSKETLIINVGLQVWSVVTCAAFAVTVDKLGRRRQLLIAFAIMFFAFLIWTICSAKAAQTNYQNKGLSAAVLLMIFIFQGGSHFFSPAVYTLIMEIPQYSLRSKGSMIFSLAQNLAGIFSGYVNPIAIDAISWRYYIVYVALLAFDFAVVYLYLPETANMTLEEVAGIFDGEDALISWRGVCRANRQERREHASKYVENALKQVTAIHKEDIELVEHVERT